MAPEKLLEIERTLDAWKEQGITAVLSPVTPKLREEIVRLMAATGKTTSGAIALLALMLLKLATEARDEEDLELGFFDPWSKRLVRRVQLPKIDVADLERLA